MATTMGFLSGQNGFGAGNAAFAPAYPVYAGSEALALSRLGGVPVLASVAPLASPLALQAAQQDQLLGAMMTMLLSLMQNSGASDSSLSSPSSLGGDSLGSAAAVAAGGGGASASTGTSSGAAGSVEMAQKYLGRSAISLKGDLQNYSAAGGTGNDCADFVSGILANTQGFKKVAGDASVATFKTHLTQQGWQKVDKGQARAGDVVIFNGSQHTELVTKDGGKEAIGSNGGATNQTIKTDSLSWGSQEFYHKG